MHANRRIEVVLARIRMGHTVATHGPLLKREPPPPVCVHCQGNPPLTFRHILNSCKNYEQQRRHIFGAGTFNVLGTLTDGTEAINSLVKFLTQAGIISIF